MAAPVRIAFLGCGFITRVHSRHLKALGRDVAAGYASRDTARSLDYCRRFGGFCTWGHYEAAIVEPRVDAVVIAVPPRLQLELTLRALAAGKRVLVEKPAFVAMAD
jgi:predicted dehydrogenase